MPATPDPITSIQPAQQQLQQRYAVRGPFVVRTQDIITGVFSADQAGRISEETYAERIARVTPSRGDLLYSRRDSARARIMVMVKRIWNKYGYPPDLRDEAV